jgi:hypothetical protein
LGHAYQTQASATNTQAMDAHGWDDHFWKEIGLGDLADGRYAKIGVVPSSPLGSLLLAYYVTVSRLRMTSGLKVLVLVGDSTTDQKS